MLVPLDQNQRRDWIKYQLRLRGSSLYAVAREMGVSRHAPRLALVKPYPRMEQAIASTLEMEPRSIWPERYDADGQPNRTIGRPGSYRHGDSLNHRDGNDHK